MRSASTPLQLPLLLLAIQRCWRPAAASGAGSDEGAACAAGGDGAGAPGCAPAPHWPCKGGNTNHSGLAQHAGVFDLSRPSWVFEEPDRWAKGKDARNKAFQSSPVVDGELNVYIQSSTGWVYSVDRRGRLRWSFEASWTNPGGLALLDGVVFTVCMDGTAFAIDAATGREVWRRKISESAPADSHSLVAAGGTVVAACNQYAADAPWRPHPYGGSDHVCAFHAANGTIKWTFNMVPNISFNQVHVILGGVVFFSDMSGGVYCVSLVDGAEIWYVAGKFPFAWTTASMAMGPNDVIYYGFNPGHPSAFEPGLLRAHDIESGDVIWSKRFHEPINAPPAVGPVSAAGGRTLAVVVAVGGNPSCEPVSSWERTTHWLGLSSSKKLRERLPMVFALDAASGEELWSFAAPPFGGPCAGITPEDGCCPSMWGQPTIGADGVVYANWSGGRAYALRDTNGDGVVDSTDPSEVSSYHHGLGTVSDTAIAPGLTALANCKQVLGYVS